MRLPAIVIILILLLFGISTAPASGAQGQKLTAREILDKVDDLYRGDSSKGTMTMEIVTENWSRTLSMEFWTKGKDKSLFRILSPKKEKGTATLRSGNDIWNFLPKVNRTIKVPSSMMSQSWMGSHFTNDDLVRDSRMADDYTFDITFEGKRDGVNITEITCIPKPDAAIVWGKVVIDVRQNDYMPTTMFYYDEDLNLTRSMIFSDIQVVNGMEMPLKLTVIPTDKPKESTIVSYSGLEFNIAVDDGFFSLRNLQK